MTQVYVGIGSNCNRQQNVALALTRLKRCFGELTYSPVYESPPVDGRGDNYYNLVVGFQSDPEPQALKGQLRGIETALGRQRDSTDVTIDLDLLLCGELVGRYGDLELPHPDLRRYRHVLQPLFDLLGDLRLPGSHETLGALLTQEPVASSRLEQIREL